MFKQVLNPLKVRSVLKTTTVGFQGSGLEGLGF